MLCEWKNDEGLGVAQFVLGYAIHTAIRPLLRQ